MNKSYDIVILGLSITSSWGNGHATTWRSLIKGLGQRKRRVLFVERDQPWYVANRDLKDFPYCDIALYSNLDQLEREHAQHVRDAGAAIVGSYVPDGVRVCRWVLNEAQGVRAFYDIDTPVTVAHLRTGDCTYLHASLVPEFDLMLSFTGGPLLQQLKTRFGARQALPLYCSVDVDEYRPCLQAHRYDLGYMGTYSDDRQPTLQRLLVEPALQLEERRFAVVGPKYPESLRWPGNVTRIDHLAPAEHRGFYASQRYTLNVTRAYMVKAGYSPSVRLFEAAACGTPIVSDVWPGIEEFFIPNMEILLARQAADVVDYLQNLSEPARLRIAAAARERVCMEHSGLRRANQLDDYLALARAHLSAAASVV